MEYSDNYSKTTGSTWQYYWDESFLDTNDAIQVIFGKLLKCQ